MLQNGASSLLRTPSPRRGLDDSLYHLESVEMIMRGRFTDQGGLFSYIAPDKRVPANHPLRKVRELVRDVLSDLNRSLGKLYASEGRPSIPPEQLLSALLLQVFYGIRSERQLMEQLDYNLLYRWFVGLSPDDPVWDPTTFTKNREQLQNGDVFTKFMTRLKARRKAAGRRITAGEDKAYDIADHVANLRAIGVTPHVTQNQAVTKTGKNRNSAIDERTTRHKGYGMSQSRRAMVECIFGWGKQHGTMRKTKHPGIARVAADFLLNLIAYNPIRIPKLLAA